MTVTPYTSFWHVNPLHDPREALSLAYILSILTVTSKAIADKVSEVAQWSNYCDCGGSKKPLGVSVALF